MKKIFVFLFTLLVMSNSDCTDHATYETDMQTYQVIEKGNNVSSHFNIFHENGFSVETDYFLTLQNISTGHTFVHKCRNGEEYYQYQVDKRYKCKRFHEDWKH